MVWFGVVPSVALVLGAAVGLVLDPSPHVLLCAIPVMAAAAAILWRRERGSNSYVVTCVAFAACGAALAIDARRDALHPSIRSLLDRHAAGFSIDSPGPPPPLEPVQIRIRLTEDAAAGPQVTALRARVVSAWLEERWHPAEGGLIVGIGGTANGREGNEWVAGRTLELPVSVRRPARYLNDGVPDFERDLALDGTALFASAKSGLLVDVRGHGTSMQEMAARVRRAVRQRVSTWVTTHDPVSGAVVAAVLIGDRSGLPDDVRLRLQAAGTYHVIAISGGNIAILAALCLALLKLVGRAGRVAAAVTLVVLLAYAGVVTPGASVWRATLMAALYLSARLLDQRSPPWHALAITAAVVIVVRPLDVRDVGWLLTFGATAALLDVSRRMRGWRLQPHPARWIVGSVAASLATEAVLLPVSAYVFSRVTIAGLVLNLAAVPLMGVVQIAGIAVVVFGDLDRMAQAAGWIAHVAAQALVDSARLVDVLPWLSVRVPPPSAGTIAAYYAALAVALVARGRIRLLACGALAAAVALTVGGVWWPPRPWSSTQLRVTVFDVGQGEAILVEPPGSSPILVDSGGIPFGSGGFDVGARVLAPALWRRRVRRLGTQLITHGDPDHLGGARAVLDDFRPAQLWQGVPVLAHAQLQEWLAAARARGLPTIERRAGERIQVGGATLRVLHPEPPDWERSRVRNDDSVVIEVVLGDVAVLLTGDISAPIERAVLPHLTPARIRILKVAHHGSRTSSSRELLEGWRPQIAVISCGRGNLFGHPAPEVLHRLAAIGATVYRTDRDGQITLVSDGRAVSVTTYLQQ